jgi:hypothetical protein
VQLKQQGKGVSRFLPLSERLLQAMGTKTQGSLDPTSDSMVLLRFAVDYADTLPPPVQGRGQKRYL